MTVGHRVFKEMSSRLVFSPSGITSIYPFCRLVHPFTRSTQMDPYPNPNSLPIVSSPPFLPHHPSYVQQLHSPILWPPLPSFPPPSAPLEQAMPSPLLPPLLLPPPLLPPLLLPLPLLSLFQSRHARGSLGARRMELPIARDSLSLRVERHALFSCVTTQKGQWDKRRWGWVGGGEKWPPAGEKSVEVLLPLRIRSPGHNG